MSYQLTYGTKIQKQLQFVEGAAGTYKTIPATPTFIHAGPIRTLSNAIEIESLNYRQIGSPDRYAEIKLGTLYSYTASYFPVDDTLIKHGINLPGGSGTIERDLQMLKSQLVNGLEKYQWYLGSRVNTTEISIASDTAVQVTQELICSEITDWAASHGLTGQTFATNPSALPWTNVSPGQGNTPLRFNGVQLHTNNATFSVNNNLTRVKPNGEVNIMWLDPTFRDITFSFSTYLKGGAERADLVNLTPRTLEYRLTTTKRLILEGAVLKSLNDEDNAESTDPKMEDFAGTASTIRIEDYTP